MSNDVYLLPTTIGVLLIAAFIIKYCHQRNVRSNGSEINPLLGDQGKNNEIPPTYETATNQIPNPTPPPQYNSRPSSPNIDPGNGRNH